MLSAAFYILLFCGEGGDDLVDAGCAGDGVGFLPAFGGHGGAADAHAAGLGGGTGLAGHAVFVQRDTVAIQLVLHVLAGEGGMRFCEID